MARACPPKIANMADIPRERGNMIKVNFSPLIFFQKGVRRDVNTAYVCLYVYDCMNTCLSGVRCSFFPFFFYFYLFFLRPVWLD